MMGCGMNTDDQLGCGRNPDERQVVRVLVELAAVEAGKNWRGSTLDHMAFELPDSWREVLTHTRPARGDDILPVTPL